MYDTLDVLLRFLVAWFALGYTPAGAGFAASNLRGIAATVATGRPRMRKGGLATSQHGISLLDDLVYLVCSRDIPQLELALGNVCTVAS